MSLTASGSVFVNALLHGLRPKRQFERFYLVLAAGGVVGGIISSTVIPVLLPLPIEFVLVSTVLLVVAMLWLTARREPQVILITAAVIFIPVFGLGLHQRNLDAINGGVIKHLRDLYGHMMLKTDDHSVVLSSDTTLHGTQLTTNLASRRRPTLYYSESSGVGRVIQRLQAGRPQMRVGIVGLGAGTIAAYARPGDAYDFWDIDPKALRVARQYFTYVAESLGHVNLIQRDGRKALEASRDTYDLIVIDAFVGDGVPSHLLTREALEAYFSRLAPKNGLLLVHASTRYSRLFPVVEATARTLLHSSVDVVTQISATTPTSDWDPTRTEYIIVGQPGQIRDMLAWFPVDEDNGRVKRTLSTVDIPRFDPQLIWTDDRNAAIDAFELGRFFFE